MKFILIIDDDTRNTFALSAILKANSFQTFIANNMVEAFAILESEKEIGIILLDMMMPGMDGYDAIPVLKSSEEYKQLPIVAVTAQAMQGDKEKCLKAGADDYLSKPVDLDELLAIIKAHIK
ncbi:MAG: response regulator [Parafilimonas sp.]|nr:response regulator [Parafilimonas sp.]